VEKGKDSARDSAHRQRNKNQEGQGSQADCTEETNDSNRLAQRVVLSTKMAQPSTRRRLFLWNEAL